MNLKEYMHLKMGNTNKIGLTSHEFRTFGIKRHKGWFEKNKNLEITNTMFQRLKSIYLKNQFRKRNSLKRVERAIFAVETKELSNYNTDDKLLYLFKNIYGFYKIGISKNPHSRAQAISNQSGILINVVAIWKIEIDAIIVEKYLHHTFKLCRTIGEWFKPNFSISDMEKHISTLSSFQRISLISELPIHRNEV